MPPGKKTSKARKHSVLDEESDEKKQPVDNNIIQPTPKRVRLGKQGMEEAFQAQVAARQLAEANNQQPKPDKYSQCPDCMKVYTRENKHTCRVTAPTAASLPSQSSDNNDSTPPVKMIPKKSCSTVKQYLSASIMPAQKQWLIPFLQNLVMRQHWMKYMASRLLLGYILDQLKEVTIYNILPYLAENGTDPFLYVEQNLCKQALSLCSNDGQVEHHSETSITEYFKWTFLPTITHSAPQRPSGKHISGTSLQYCAQEMDTGFCNMQDVNFLPKTGTWITDECTIMGQQNPGNEIFSCTAVRKRLKSWMIHLYSDTYFHDVQSWTQTLLKTSLIASLQPKKNPRQSIVDSVNSVWNALYMNLIYPITKIMTLIIQKMQVEKYKSSYQLLWIYVIMKRMECLQTLVQAGEKQPDGGSSHQQKRLFKQFTLFPLPGFVPGHILITDKLMQLTGHSDWKQYFKKKPSFWSRQRAGNSYHCNKFSTDGVDICFLFDDIKLVPEKPPYVPRSSTAAAMDVDHTVRMKPGYIQVMDLNTLKNEQHVKGILTIDTNQKNFFVAAFTTIDEAMSKGTNFHEIDCKTLSISKREWLTVRGTKRRAKKEKTCSSIPDPDVDQESHDELIHNKSSIKGSSHANFLKYMAELDLRLDYILRLYARKTFRRLRMESYTDSQTAYSYVQDKIYREINVWYEATTGERFKVPRHTNKLSATDDRILIVIGDGAFGNNGFSGHARLPSGNKLFRELKKMNENVCWVDEFRTSKCCSGCGNDKMKKCEVEQRKYKLNPSTQDKELVSKELVRPWGLRACASTHCRNRVWDRDVNAVLNMLRRCGNYLNQSGVAVKTDLEYMRRGNRTQVEDDDDEEDNDDANIVALNP